LSKKSKRSPGYKYSKHSKAAAAPKSKINAWLIAAVCVAVAGAGGYYGWSYFNSSSSSPEVTTASGLKYVDEVVGTGESPSPGRTVSVHYTGRLENGTVFDSSAKRGVPFDFQIGTGGVIKGWDEGVMSMKVGGKRKLIIPPSLGYGSQDKGSIPPNSTLIFDVELLAVK
jgi:FKBP-type peptidyl-prolyl cis-trans isomerase